MSIPSRLVNAVRMSMSRYEYGRARKDGQLRTGDRFSIGPFARCSARSTAAPSIVIGSHVFLDCSLITRGGGRIAIGSACWFGGAGSTAIGATESVTIGSDVIISNHVHIYDNNNHPTDPDARRRMTQGELAGPLWEWTEAASAPVVVEDNVWIGEFSMILKGVTVGRGSVVAAHSVVTKDVPPYTIAAGNPAKTIKRLR